MQRVLSIIMVVVLFVAVRPSAADDLEVSYTLVSPTETQGGDFGYSVSGAGDVNNDGIGDWIIGGREENAGSSPDDAGRAHVFDGSTTALLHTFLSQNEEEDGRFGSSVACAGDVNNDGYDDVIVGAYREDLSSTLTNAGRAYLFSGSNGALIRTLVSPNQDRSGYFGASVSRAGDVNDDGYDDVIVGAYNEEQGDTDIGRAYVFSGVDGNLIRTLVSPNSQGSGRFGISVSDAGDINDDGTTDVIVGADGENSWAGRAYAFSGATGTCLRTLVSPNPQGNGFFGRSVSGVDDINDDGADDLVVGAIEENPGTSPADAGRAYIFSGATGILLNTLVSPDEQSGGNFGCSVSGISDLTRAGGGDVIVGAPGELSSGRAHIYDGATGLHLQMLISPNEESGGDFGYSVSGLASGDVLIGAYGEDQDPSLAGAGRAYVFSPTMVLSSTLSGGILQLEWPPALALRPIGSTAPGTNPTSSQALHLVSAIESLCSPQPARRGPVPVVSATP